MYMHIANVADALFWNVAEVNGLFVMTSLAYPESVIELTDEVATQYLRDEVKATTSEVSELMHWLIAGAHGWILKANAAAA
ncbi:MULTISPECIES: hypothetical protein [unclassified Nocardia]|uniref:hypothetical protein n=1 Tax=unclassified Nocardia TaxID=2637762 RepID=UPI00339DB4AA